jgi:hypothetical protein
MHPALKFQIERTAREYCKWRAIPGDSDRLRLLGGGNQLSRRRPGHNRWQNRPAFAWNFVSVGLMPLAPPC